MKSTERGRNYICDPKPDRYPLFVAHYMTQSPYIRAPVGQTFFLLHGLDHINLGRGG